MSNPNPNPEPRTLDAWEDAADAYAAAVRSGANPARRVTEKAILDLVRQVPAGPVLDAGCGEGWVARELAVNHEVVAMDGSGRMIELCEARGDAHAAPDLACASNNSSIGAGAQVPGHRISGTGRQSPSHGRIRLVWKALSARQPGDL